MRALLMTLLMSAMCALSLAETIYYVNIDNAPNGSATGTMEVYFQGDAYPHQTTTLTFIENYYGEMGGKYRSSSPLTQSTAATWVIIKCHAKKPWEPDWRRGYSQQTFTGGALTQLPTIHIEDTPNPPNDPSYPK